MDSTSEINTSVGPLEKTVFYSDPDAKLDLFNPYFFVAVLPRNNSNYTSLLLLFTQEDIQNIRNGESEYRDDELSEYIREDCLVCGNNPSLYEVDGFSGAEPMKEDTLRTVRMCGDCFESVRSSIFDHIQEESQIVQYEL